MFKESVLVIQLALFFYAGIHNVWLKNILVSHDGNNSSGCGDWTSPCRTVRHAIAISAAYDVIYIDHFNGVAYEECELHDNTILLNKSLTFTGYNGVASLSCRGLNYAFFTLHSPGIISKFVFSNLSFTCANGQLFCNRNKKDRLALFVDNIYSNSSVIFQSQFCSIHLKDSIILGEANSLNQIQIKCPNLTVRFAGSTFICSWIELQGNDAIDSDQLYDIFVTNCTFECERESVLVNGPVIWLKPTTFVYKIVIDTSIFKNFQLLQKPSVLMILVNGGKKGKSLIFLDRLLFERTFCSSGAVHFASEYSGIGHRTYGIDVGIYNSRFINSSTALAIYTNENVTILNNSFLHTAMNFESLQSIIELDYNGFYNISNCNFHVAFSGFTSKFTLIKIDSSATIDLWNIFTNFTIVKNEDFVSDVDTRQFIVLTCAKNSRINSVINEYFTVLCPTGFNIIFEKDCKTAGRTMECSMFSASCQQCKEENYSLERGELHFNIIKNVACNYCPEHGICIAGQLRAEPNFWGYKYNEYFDSVPMVSFQQCPPKYCCDKYVCPDYNSCHGERTGTLCGACPEGMSESLFDTTCIKNKECTSTLFWPGYSAFLILFLLFFLFQEDIINFVVTRVFPKCCFRGSRNLKGNGLLKIFFYYYQVIFLLRGDVRSNINIIDKIKNVVSAGLNFRIIGISTFVCPFQDLRPVSKTIILHSVGYCLLVMLVLLYLCALLVRLLRKLWRRCSGQTADYTNDIRRDANGISDKFVSRFLVAFTNISLLMYGSAAHVCLSLLHCVPLVDNFYEIQDQVLFLDGNVKCYQGFQLAYILYLILCILPFCLVPVFGSYLLKFCRIGVKQFCAACLFPFPFCCFWFCLLLRGCRLTRQLGTFDPLERSSQTVTREERNNETQCEEVASTTNGIEISSHRNSAEPILNVLFGAFRSHRAFLCFPSGHISWEGFLIFRRLVLIIVLTFIYNNELKMLLALTVCIVILMIHVSVNPFRSKRDNVLESFSLAIHVLLCAITYSSNPEDPFIIQFSSFFFLRLSDFIEIIVIAFPLTIIIIVITFSIVVKILSGLISFLLFLIRKAQSSLI